MSLPTRSGVTKKKWPWWVRALGWFLGVVLLIQTIIFFVLSGIANHHPGGKEEYQKDAEAKIKLKDLEFKLWLLKRSKGKYPSDEEGLAVLYPIKDKTRVSAMDQVGDSDEAREKLLDPWGRRYRYRTPGAHNKDSYDLYSLGPDGIEATEDDITNW